MKATLKKYRIQESNVLLERYGHILNSIDIPFLYCYHMQHHSDVSLMLQWLWSDIMIDLH